MKPLDNTKSKSRKELKITIDFVADRNEIFQSEKNLPCLSFPIQWNGRNRGRNENEKRERERRKKIRGWKKKQIERNEGKETFRGNLRDSETNVGLIKGNSKRFLVKAARRLEGKGRSNGSV